MLFRSFSQGVFGSWITRTVTQSHFDHVGILLRFGDTVGDIYVFEAVGNKGVRLTSWLSIRNEAHKDGFYESIAYRKLGFTMSSHKLEELDTFRRNSVGKPYGI